MRVLVVLQAGDGRVVFEARGVTLSEANALRRAVLDDIPVAGVESARVDANSTYLYDDILVDRVAALPVGLAGTAWDAVAPREVLAAKFPCEAMLQRKAGGRIDVCERGCSKCSVRFEGTAKAKPALESADIRVAPQDGSEFEIRSGASDAERAALGPRGFLIAWLEPGHVVKVSGRVRLGYGREHHKFRAVCGPVRMVRAHRVRVDPDASSRLTPGAAADLLRACPVGLFTFDPASSRLEVANLDRVVDQVDRVNAAARAAADACGLPRAPVHAEAAPDVFLFSAELRGQVGPHVLIREAARAWARTIGQRVSIDWGSV